MCKSADRGMVIGDLALWEKTGGRSGTYRRPEVAATGDGDDGDRSDPPIDVSEGTTVVASSSANVVES